MILRSLSLTNFRKFKHVEVDFPDGVVGIFGLNGVGKSTLFESVAWALYGHTASRTSSDEIKRVNAPPSERCRVVVDFIFNENRYRVIREMIGKNLSPSATVTMNGKVVANGAEATTKFIQKLFGMDVKSFFTSLFAKQKELNALSTLTPSERKQLILRMLGIDALDEVIGKIRSDIKGTKGLIDKYNLFLKDEITGKLKKDIYREEINKKEKEKERLLEIINLDEKSIKKLEEELKVIGAEKDSIQQKYEDAQIKLGELRKIKETYERRKNLEREIKNIESSLKEREEELKKKIGEIGKYKLTDEQLQDVRKKLEDVDSKLKDVLRKIQEAVTQLKNLEKEVGKIESKKARIESLGPSAECPTCERVLGEHYQKLIEKFRKEISEKEEEKKKIEQILKNSEREKENLDRLRDALSRRERYLTEMKMKERELHAIIESIEREIEKEREDKRRKEEELLSISTVTFDEEAFQELEKKTKYYYEEYKRKIKELEEKQGELHTAKEKIKAKEGDLKLFKEQIQELKNRVKEQEEIEKRIEEEKEKLSNLNLLEDVMISFRVDMISRIRPTLSTYASKLLETLTDGKYSTLELDENYEILIYDNGIPYQINRFSGGEEDLANLCIRLAISEMLTERAGGEFNLIILDEVFGSQDINRRRNILSTLNLLSNKFRQIFVITHIEDVKQFVNNAILVYELEDGTSGIKIE